MIRKKREVHGCECALAGISKDVSEQQRQQITADKKKAMKTVDTSCGIAPVLSCILLPCAMFLESEFTHHDKLGRGAGKGGEEN